MPRPLVPPADRFWARVDRFACECPACGYVISAALKEAPGPLRTAQARRHSGRAAVSSKARKWHQQVYNPLTARCCCPACRRVWAVGLVLYPVAPRCLSRQPSDTKPTWRQLLDLRQRAQGFLAEQAIKGDQPVNIAAVLECTCPEVKGGWAPACPVHGDERLKRHRADTEVSPPTASTDPEPDDS